jgi:hypothetical protein
MRNQTLACRLRVSWVCAVTVALGVFAFTGTAFAQTYNVTNEATFEAAVASVNNAGGVNTINFAAGAYSPTATIDFTSGTVTLQGVVPTPMLNVPPVKFTGGAIVPTGSTLFSVATGVSVNFSDIQITTAGSPGNGVIDDSGTVNVDQSSITGAGPGLTVEAGGIAATLDSTFSDGLDVGIVDDGGLTLTNTTVTRNSNGGIDNVNGTLSLVNSIVAENGSPDCTGDANATDHSLDGDGTCGVGALSATNPHLGSLNFHGGSTPTDIPAAGSPVIQAGDPAKCPPVDQRGAASPSVAAKPCDIGSVETYYGVAPVLTSPNLKEGSASAAGTAVTFTPTWSAGSPVTSVSCSPASGSTFPVGTTTVTCSGTDSVYGATGTGTFTVTDVQDTPPVVTTSPSGTDTVAATSTSGATVTFTASATDSVDGTDPVTCTPASGSTFPVGTTTVTCSATDSNSLTGTATLKIVVTPYTPPPAPTITVPADISVNATSAAGAVVTYTASATDPAGAPNDPVTCSPPSGSTFAIGTTTVTCNATSRAGVAATKATFTITVEPGSSPVVTVPADISAAATGPGGAQVTYAASATDPVEGSVPVTCTPASGSTFPIGTTTVNCTATDTTGNVGKNSFTVTVSESTPPTLTTPANMTVAATKAGGAVVSFTVTATDPVDGALTPTCTPASGSTFPVGTTTVNCSATDKVGLTTSGSFTITVPTPTGPVITVPAYRVLGALTAAGDPVTYTATATDQIDATDPVTCTPASGATFPVGTTTVTCTATDSGGRTATATFAITVLAPETTTAAPSNVFTFARETVEGHAVVVSLKLPAAGRALVVATFKGEVKGKTKTLRFGTVSEKFGSGAKKVTIKATKAALAELASLGASKKLTVTVTVRFTPTGGTARSKHVTVKVKGD